VLLVAAHLFLSASSMSFGARVAEGALVLAALHVLGRAVDAGARGARGSFAWLVLAAGVCACGPVGTYFVPQAKTPEERARQVEEDKCGGITEDSISPLLRARGLDSVEPSYAQVLGGPNGRESRLRGARIHVRPADGLTREGIARGLECHQSRVVLGRWPAQENEPWVLPHKWVEFDVSSEKDGFVVSAESSDIDDAKAILARSQAFVRGK
jgi:hypothetical protein